MLVLRRYGQLITLSCTMLSQAVTNFPALPCPMPPTVDQKPCPASSMRQVGAPAAAAAEEHPDTYEEVKSPQNLVEACWHSKPCE